MEDGEQDQERQWARMREEGRRRLMCGSCVLARKACESMLRGRGVCGCAGEGLLRRRRGLEWEPDAPMGDMTRSL